MTGDGEVMAGDYRNDYLNLEGAVKFFVGLTTATVGVLAASAPHVTMTKAIQRNFLALTIYLCILSCVTSIAGAVAFYLEVTSKRVPREALLRTYARVCGLFSLLSVMLLASAGSILWLTLFQGSAALK